MTMSGGSASDGHGAGVAVCVAPAAAGAPVGAAVAVAVGVAGHGEPGGVHGLSGVGCTPLAQGAPEGPMTLPWAVGAVNVATLNGATADFMNFCQIVAGSVPPDTSMPWTFVIGGVVFALASNG
jgi:hypothetical protein